MQIFSRCHHLRLFILIVVIEVSICDRWPPEILISFFNVILQLVDLVDVVDRLRRVVPVAAHPAQESIRIHVSSLAGKRRRQSSVLTMLVFSR